jgi:hypothetical protein
MLLAKELFSDELGSQRLGKKKKGLPDFVRISVEGILRKKKSKVLELKEIETLEGSIEKIETLVAKLKIAANFRG